MSNKPNSKPIVGDIVKSISFFLPKDKYYVVNSTYNDNGISYYLLELLENGERTLNGFRQDLLKVITEDDTEDIKMILNTTICEKHKALVGKLLMKSKEVINPTEQIDSLSKVLNLAIENTSKEQVIHTLMKLLPISEVQLGVKYRHFITGKEYYLVQDTHYKPQHSGLTYYLLVDNDTHKTVNELPEETASMQRFIRDMGLQMEHGANEL